MSYINIYGNEETQDDFARPNPEGKPEQKQPDCSQHPKDLYGETDMKKAAEVIGNLNYDSLSTLLYHLSDKLYIDGRKDFNAGRTQLSEKLFEAQKNVHRAYQMIDQAFKRCERFM